MNVTGSWRIVSSPDFDDDYVRMEVEPYVELHQRSMMYPFVKTEKGGFLKCKVSFLVAFGGYAIPCLFFAWYRHLGVTLPSQGRAGASLIGARRASTCWPSARATWP